MSLRIEVLRGNLQRRQSDAIKPDLLTIYAELDILADLVRQLPLLPTEIASFLTTRQAEQPHSHHIIANMLNLNISSIEDISMRQKQLQKMLIQLYSL